MNENAGKVAISHALSHTHTVIGQGLGSAGFLFKFAYSSRKADNRDGHDFDLHGFLFRPAFSSR